LRLGGTTLINNRKISDEEPIYTHIWGVSSQIFTVFAVIISIPISVCLPLGGECGVTIRSCRVQRLRGSRVLGGAAFQSVDVS
jgi:hypothetical protein